MKEPVMAYWRYCTRLCLEELRESMQHLDQGSQCLPHIRTEHLQNTNLEHYSYVNKLRTRRHIPEPTCSTVFILRDSVT
jgi:hypothetical protein